MGVLEGDPQGWEASKPALVSGSQPGGRAVEGSG